MSQSRSASLFRNGRNQAVRIPREFELEGSQVLIRKDGESLVITPMVKPAGGLAALAAKWEAIDDEFPEIDDPPPEQVDPFE